MAATVIIDLYIVYCIRTDKQLIFCSGGSRISIRCEWGGGWGLIRFFEVNKIIYRTVACPERLERGGGGGAQSNFPTRDHQNILNLIGKIGKRFRHACHETRDRQKPVYRLGTGRGVGGILSAIEILKTVEKHEWTIKKKPK